MPRVKRRDARDGVASRPESPRRLMEAPSTSTHGNPAATTACPAVALKPWQRWEAPYLFALLVGGLGLRLALTPFGIFASDARVFRGWATRLVTSPLASFYATGGGRGGGTVDHLPGDLWFLWLIARVYQHFSPRLDTQGFGFVFLLKLVPSLADVGIGLLLFAIARRLAGPRAGLLAAAGWLFNPASIFLSVSWGQWDSISACVTLLAIWLALRGNPVWALPALTYACLIKPQLGVLVPLVLLAWWLWHWRVRPAGAAAASRRHGPRQLGALAVAAVLAAAVFLAVDLPFSVGLPPLATRWTIVERASAALNRYTIISANAFNLWGVLSPGDLRRNDHQHALLGVTFQQLGTLLLAATLIAILALFWRHPTPDMLVWAATATLLALFMLPTRMHERYLLPAVALAALAAACAPRRLWWLGVALSATFLVNLVVVYRLAGGGNVAGGSRQSAASTVLVVSSVNLCLLLALLAVGVTLARRPLGLVGEVPPASAPPA